MAEDERSCSLFLCLFLVAHKKSGHEVIGVETL